MGSKPRILFRVDANSLIGWGHFYRSLSLALMLRSEFNISFAIAGVGPQAQDILNKHGFHLIPLPEQEYSLPDGRGSEEFPFDLEGQLDETDIVVLDGYWFGGVYQRELRKQRVKVAVIEDAGRGRYDADLIINHAPGLDKKNYQTSATNPAFALGPEYCLLRPAFLMVARMPYKQKKELEKILVSFGGSDYHNFTVKTLDWFLQNTEVQLVVVTGVAYQHREQLQRQAERWAERVILKQNLGEREMCQTMMEADASILPASGILFEAIACRLPVISGTYTGNQQSIFKGFLHEDVLINGGDFSDLSQAWVELQQENLLKMQRRQANLIDGKSPERFKKIFACLL